MNQQRQTNIEQEHRNQVRHIVESLLRMLAPHDIDEWLGLNYSEMLECAGKVLEEECADVNESR
jgi:hypothetical protein